MATSITSIKSGNWSDPGVWDTGTIPGDGDEVFIADGHSVLIDQNIGTSTGIGLLMLHVGSFDGSTAQLKFNGSGSPSGYQVTFADGPGTYGIDLFGILDLEGSPAHPPTITPRTAGGSAYTFIRKNSASTHLRLIVKNVILKNLGNEFVPGVDARNAKTANDMVIFSGNQLDQSGGIQLLGADGSVASITISGNVAAEHKGSFVQFQGAKNLLIDHNQVAIASFPGEAPGQAIIDGIKGDGVSTGIRIENNTLVSKLNADTASGCTNLPPRRYGIWLQELSNSTAQGNHISAVGAPESCVTYPGFYGFEEGIHLFSGNGSATNIVIAENSISNTIHGIGVATGPGDTPIQVIRNIVFDDRNEHIYIASGSQIEISNNILYGHLNIGLAGILLYNTDLVKIINNTLDGLQQPSGPAVTGVHGIAIGNKGVGTATNVTIVSNILTHWGEAIQNRDSGNSFKEVGHNLFFGNLKDQDDLAAAGSRLPAGQVGNVYQDPLYLDPGSRDYHLQAGSPAIDHASSAASPSVDFDGEARPVGPGFDIGADEFSAKKGNLAIGMADSPDPAGVGTQLTYTVTVTNSGPATAIAVTVRDPLPPQVRFISAVPSQGTCSGSIEIICSLDNLPFPGAATMTLTVTPMVAGTLTNSATVTDSANENAVVQKSVMINTAPVTLNGGGGGCVIARTESSVDYSLAFLLGALALRMLSNPRLKSEAYSTSWLHRETSPGFLCLSIYCKRTKTSSTA